MSDKVFKVAGVLQSEPDQRDYIYRSSTLNFPRKYSREQYIVEYEDQLSQGACVGNGVASALETYGNTFGMEFDLSRQFIYNAGRNLEGRLGESGMYVRTGVKVPQKFGVPDEVDYPYFTTTNRDENPPQEIYDLAANRKIGRYELVFAPVDFKYGVTETYQKIDAVKGALLDNLNPVIGLGVTASIYDMKGPRKDHRYQTAGPGVPVIGGHLMYIIGWDDVLEGFIVVNSWGQDWGDYGIGLFPYHIVNELFAECWVMRDFAGFRTPEVPGVKVEVNNRYTVGVRIVPEPEQLGTTTNVWIGAQLPTGEVFLNHSLTEDAWAPLIGNDYTPAGSIVLQEDNPMYAVHRKDMADLTGAKLYVAYGNSPFDWNLQHVYTVRPFMKL